MAKILFADKASTTMSGSLASGLGTLNVTPGGGARFPAPTGGDFFYATLYQKDVGGAEINIEVVKITAKPSADSFTVSQRDVTNITGYGGGYAYPGTAGTVYVELRWLEKAAVAMMQAADMTATNVVNTPTGGIAATTVQAALNELDSEKAPLASPALTGTPTVPTAGAGTSTTQAASTQFVANELAAFKQAANTFTALQTIRTPSGIRSEAAATQDAVVVAGRAGGTSSYAVTVTPTTLTANRTLTIPDATTTMVGTDVAQPLTNKTIVAASNTITTAASGNLTSTNLNAALAELQSDIDTRAALSGATFTSTVQVTKNRADTLWNTAQYIVYSPAGATVDFSSTAYHVQDATNAPQWGYNFGDGSRFGLYDSNGATRLLTFPVSGLGSGVPKLTSNDLSIDAMLTALSGVTTAANKLIYATGSNTFTTTDLTVAGRALLDDADAAAQRTTLGLGTASTQASTAFAASGAITSSGLTQSTGKLIGRTTASTGAPEEITVGSGLSLSAGTLSASATGYPVVAWVKFDGTRNVTDTGASTNGNPVKIYASGGVSSVTKNATGDFTVNFSSPLADANYCVSAFFRTTAVANLFVSRSRVAAPTSSAFRLDIYNSSILSTDCEEVYLSFIR